MIVMQSGLAAADIHTSDLTTPQEYQFVIEDSRAIQQVLNEPSDDEQSTCACDFCMHCKCSHFIAIDIADAIDIASISDIHFYLHHVTHKPDFTVSMYRPPRS